MQKVKIKAEGKVAAETNPQRYIAGTLVMVNQREADALVKAGKGTIVEAVAVDAQGTPEQVHATDAAVEKASKLGVDLAKVPATGSNGQITVQDVENFRHSK